MPLHWRFSVKLFKRHYVGNSKYTVYFVIIHTERFNIQSIIKVYKFVQEYWVIRAMYTNTVFTQSDTFRVSETLGQWDIGSVRHWVSGTLGRWDIGSVRHWVSETLGRWDIGSVRHWVSETLGRWDIGSIHLKVC